MIVLVLFGFVLQLVSGVIYNLTPQEYDSLPKLTKVDEYGPCMRGPGDIYCFVEAKLHGNLSDPMYHTLVEYSANTITHFDHTKLHWGICPKKSCSKQMNNYSNLTDVVEACLNESLTRDYRLTAKIYESLCEEYSQDWKMDSSDYAFGAVILILLALNLLGSLYDFSVNMEKIRLAAELCSAFLSNETGSASRLLVAQNPCSGESRTLTAFLVVCGHSPIPSLLVGNNPQFLEATYKHIPFHLFFNGTLIVQTFFIISGFLLAYNKLLSERNEVMSWSSLPKGVLLRWLRLTPPYSLVMFFVMTWMRHLGHGPFYLKSVTSEAIACHRDWWLHLLYIHNYKDHSQCMVHAWYLAAEFQLSLLGLLIFSLLYSNRSRKIAIGVVIVAGLLTPAVHTYIQDLHAVLIVSPEVALNFFVEDPTFNNLYKRGHTNLVCYGLGLWMAYTVYNLTDSDLGAKRFKKYRLLYWLLFPMMLVIVFAGYVFYMDGMVVPIGVRVVYSSAVKFVFGILTATFLYLTVVQVDRAFRGFLHWGGWARISRVTYLAYLVHVPILRFAAGNIDELVPTSSFWIVSNFLFCVCMAYSFAVPLYITMERPLAELIGVALGPRPKVKTVGLEDLKASKDTLEVKL